MIKVQRHNKFVVFGDPIENAVEQMARCMQDDRAIAGALMADHHLGYSMPIGGVIAYDPNWISPSGVGYDIGCGNAAIKLPLTATEMLKDRTMDSIMDEVVSKITFGVGGGNTTHTANEVFDSPVWKQIPMLRGLKNTARGQLGTVGSGNHYVDIFADEDDAVWIGVHFGSRGLGHKIASHYIKEGGGVDSIDAMPVLLDLRTELGAEYLSAMTLAGEYAYAGRNWVCDKVKEIIMRSKDAEIDDYVHNHHNYSWSEYVNSQLANVVRKGATPAFCGQRGFIGGSMCEESVIVSGSGVAGGLAVESLNSTVHGAGRVMSRTQAAGKWRTKDGIRVQTKAGEISFESWQEWIDKSGIILRGGGLDEAPQAYKRLSEVLAAQGETIQIQHRLRPLGVAMAGADVFDPYKD